MNPIHPQTTIGAVFLTVRDLSRSLAFYQEVIGLAVLRQEGVEAELGLLPGGPQLLNLRENPAAPALNRPATGLYHFALLVPSRRELALVLRHLLERGEPLGASDHLVSEALYLNDPDGIGIEIYADRPRERWPIRDGQLQMATEPLNGVDLLGQIGPDDVWRGLPAGTTMGHIHLRVADIPAARSFYADGLGFERMVDYGRMATFLAAGGYHHHIGLNTWESAGASPPPDGAPGLRFFEIQIPGLDRDRLLQSLRGAGWESEMVEEDHQSAGGFFVRDPSGNRVRLVVV